MNRRFARLVLSTPALIAYTVVAAVVAILAKDAGGATGCGAATAALALLWLEERRNERMRAHLRALSAEMHEPTTLGEPRT